MIDRLALWWPVWRALWRNPAALAGAGLLLLLVASAILAPHLAPFDPLAVDMLHPLEAPNQAHLLGTDAFGRDILSRMLWGGRITLLVGLMATGLAGSLGVLLGVLAGYYGGALDALIMRLIDVLLAFPRILLALSIVGLLGPGVFHVMLAVGVAGITGYARLVRGTVLSLKTMAFMEAARASGCTNRRILFRHILPNVVGPAIVLGTLDVAAAILAASSLSFLGLGVQPPTPEWGAMLYEGRVYLRAAPWVSLFPGLVILMAALSINLVGDAWRDALDPRLHEAEFVR